MPERSLATAPIPILTGVTEFLARPPQMLIGDQFVSARSERTLDVENPATGEIITSVPEAAAEDVDLAVHAAREAFAGSWGATAPTDRARLLFRLADGIEEHGDELAQLITLEMGKPLALAKAQEIPGAAGMFRYMAGWATKLGGDTIPYGSPDRFHVYTRREPIGVVAQIIPWNAPLIMAAWKMAPALAAGCAVVLKPAEQAQLAVLRLGELISEAGFPPGTANIVSGAGSTVGAALAAHRDVDKVAFTGSGEVGRRILDAAKGNLKRVSMELGGKSPNIILADADLDLAVAGSARTAFLNSGQSCLAGTRLFVQRSVFDRVLESLSERATSIIVGDGLSPDTEMGPLVSSDQLARVSSYVEDATAKGARAAAGGSRLDRKGYFYEPTVVLDTNDQMRVYEEEVFGPVLIALPFTDFDEVVRKANDTAFGLAAGIWTRDLSTAHRLGARLRAGTVWVNGYGVGDASIPFGGFKESGWSRERGREGVELYTETKSVVISL